MLSGSCPMQDFGCGVATDFWLRVRVRNGATRPRFEAEGPLPRKLLVVPPTVQPVGDVSCRVGVQGGDDSARNIEDPD